MRPQQLSPGLGVEIQYRDYGTSCALRHPSAPLGIAWSNISSTLFDEFVLAHSLGWWAKALLLRNYTLLWAYSIGFELMELTFAVSGASKRPWLAAIGALTQLAEAVQVALCCEPVV